MKYLRILLIISLLLASLIFSAYSTIDNENIRFGKPKSKGKLLSKHGFVMMYNGAFKNPIWTSYALKKANLPPIKVKPGVFKTDKTIEPYEQVKKEDIPASYDKSPMVPVLDMAYDLKSYQDAFLMSNVCAMNPNLKRVKWRELENNVRVLAGKTNTVWIVTGPVFAYTDKKMGVIGRTKIVLPTGFYKVILYQAKDGSFHSIGFYMDNTKQEKQLSEYMMSVDSIEAMTGLDFFDALPVEVQSIMEKTQKDSYFLN